MDQLNNITQTYLNKFSTTSKLIKEPINTACKQIIVVPSYCEPDLERTLESLCNCEATAFVTEVIIVLNSPEGDTNAEQFHLEQMNRLTQKFTSFSTIRFHFICADHLPVKHAGVGLARKIGMDEAARRFQELNYDGMIICLDADCTVKENYLTELEKLTIAPESYNTVCVHFEHRIEEEKNAKLKLGIIYYELFLRYYKESLAWCGLPYAYHTIGSSMAVKTSVYCKSGGMNKRKAGEDFYFLHKVFPYGKVVELNTSCVYPSARISDRVPFGTGRAQKNFLENTNSEHYTYDFTIFKALKKLSEHHPANIDPVELPVPVKTFLEGNDFFNKIIEIRNNTVSSKQFSKRFYNWFDGFMVLKYVHFCRDNFYPLKKTEDELQKLLFQLQEKPFDSLISALHILRERQKK